MMLHALRRGALLSMLLSTGMAEVAWGLQEEPVPFVVDAATPLRMEPSETAEPLRMLAKDEIVEVAPSVPISGDFVQVTARTDNLEGWTSSADLRVSLPLGISGPAIGMDRDVQVLTPLGSHEAQHHQAPDQPTVQAFSDGKHWMLRQPLNYYILASKNGIQVPEGFVTDFASVPRELHSFVRSTGAYTAAAVVHDFLYWAQVCTRDQADRLFRLAMEESGVEPWWRQIFYAAVRVMGNGAWNENVAHRQNGMIRVVPEPHNIVPPRAQWDSYRQNLAAIGIVEGQYPLPTPAACAYGN